MQHLKCLFAAWAFPSRALAHDQDVKLFKIRVSEAPLWDFSHLGNLAIRLRDLVWGCCFHLFLYNGRAVQTRKGNMVQMGAGAWCFWAGMNLVSCCHSEQARRSLSGGARGLTLAPHPVSFEKAPLSPQVVVKLPLPAVEIGFGLKSWGTKISDAQDFCEEKVLSLSIVYV